ncbi:MAG: alpha-L-rhamnosidase [Clostridia bacterium]|nr:alpha-L-rhamnosidase [Clostridia bacterium]
MKRSTYKNEIITEYIIAEKIISLSMVENPRILLHDYPRQAILDNINFCTIKKGGYILLDFGEELCGGVVVTVHKTCAPNAKLRVVFGESVSEALSDIGEKNSGNDHSPRDFLLEVNNYSTQRVGRTGFRFVKLESINVDISISSLCAAFEHRDLLFKGSFECSDKLLNKIWHTAARTVFLNMQDYLWDGIKRDRLVWIGDMHAEVSAISCVFGDCDIVTKTLDLTMETSPAGEWMNGIASYSFWWIIILNDWYTYTGNKDYILKNSKYIITHIKNIVDAINYDGTNSFECNLGYLEDSNPYKTYFVDWETYGTPDSCQGFYSLLMFALRASSEICRVLEKHDLLRECIEKMGVIESMHFNVPSNRQIASLMSLAGLIDSEYVNNTILSKEPVADITAFLGYYTLIAKAKVGDTQGALDIIKTYWGKMLELGATSFWESFHYPSSHGACPIDRLPKENEKDIHGDFGAFCYKNFRASLCHGWACGPTPFLTSCVAGIRILEPGCKKLLIKPELGYLDYVKVVYPTPYGDVKVLAQKTKNGIELQVDAPPDIEIIKTTGN